MLGGRATGPRQAASVTVLCTDCVAAVAVLAAVILQVIGLFCVCRRAESAGCRRRLHRDACSIVDADATTRSYRVQFVSDSVYTRMVRTLRAPRRRTCELLRLIDVPSCRRIACNCRSPPPPPLRATGIHRRRRRGVRTCMN